jgi:hypothetical protein
MIEQDIEEILQRILAYPEDMEEFMEILIEEVEDVSTYSDAGILTNDKGLVLTMWDRSQFQITIVQSR